ITGPPAGINRKLGQVSETTSDSVRINAGRGAAHQCAKRTEVYVCRSLGGQISVEELVMSDLIIGIVMDVVLHLILNKLQRVCVGLVSSAARNFAVLDAAQLVILDPKVSLKYLQRRHESKQCRVSG